MSKCSVLVVAVDCTSWMAKSLEVVLNHVTGSGVRQMLVKWSYKFDKMMFKKYFFLPLSVFWRSCFTVFTVSSSIRIEVNRFFCFNALSSSVLTFFLRHRQVNKHVKILIKSLTAFRKQFEILLHIFLLQLHNIFT